MFGQKGLWDAKLNTRMSVHRSAVPLGALASSFAYEKVVEPGDTEGTAIHDSDWPMTQEQAQADLSRRAVEGNG